MNVWSASLLHVFKKKQEASEDGDSHHGDAEDSTAAKVEWLGVTLLGVTFAALVSYSLPYFSILMAIIASLGDLASMLGLPCLFSIKLLRLKAPEKALCWLLVVLSVVLSALGIVSSVHQLLEESLHGG